MDKRCREDDVRLGFGSETKRDNNQKFVNEEFRMERDVLFRIET